MSAVRSFCLPCSNFLHPRRRRHGPQPDRRRALELLAASHDGCTEASMLAHGFTTPQMIKLVS